MKMSLKGKTFKALVRLLCLLLMAGLLAACGGKGEEAASQPSDGKHLSYGISNAWDALMPYHSISGSNYARIIYDKIYDRLAYVQADGTCLPRAADSWESTDEGCGIVFALNDKAAFHDGVKVTAEHWAQTFRLMTDPACPTLGRTAFAGISGTDENGAQIPGETLGVEVLDEYTLKLRFDSPVIPEEFLIAHNRDFYVLPTHLMEGVPASEIMELALWKAPVGSGPMEYQSEISGSVLTLAANKAYHLGAPGFDTMTITVIDKANQLSALIAGDLDYYTFGNAVSQENAPLARAAGFRLIEGAVPTTFYELMLNNERVDQKQLRRAIDLALDRELLSQQNSGDLGDPAISSILPGTAYARTAQPEELARDLETAAQLVADYYDGSTLTLACTSARASIAALVQQNLQEAGFQVEIQTVDSATLFAGMYDGEYDMAIASHTPSTLPLWFVGTRFREDSNLFRVQDLSGYAARIAAVDGCVTVEDRLELVIDLERYLKDELPFIPLWFTTPLYAESKTVRGIDYPAASFSNENVWEWSLS